MNTYIIARDSICYSAYMLSPVVPLSVRLVCLSVRLSVTRVDQSKTLEVRIMQLSPSSSPMTLVSSWLISPRNSKWNIGSGTPSKRGVGKIGNFQPISRRISETAQDRTKVTINDMRFRLVPKSTTLNDLEML